jgi:hypothetical protein
MLLAMPFWVSSYYCFHWADDVCWAAATVYLPRYVLVAAATLKI